MKIHEKEWATNDLFFIIRRGSSGDGRMNCEKPSRVMRLRVIHSFITGTIR